MLVASQEEALRSRRAKCPRSEQSQVTLECELRAYEVSHLLNLLRRHPPVCTNLLTTDCVGTESGTGHSQAFPTIIYSYVKVVTETESYGDGGVAMGAGGGYHWKHLVRNLHVWRPGRDGRLLADPERQQHPYPTQATEQPSSGTALLSSHEEGERIGSLNTARSSESVGRPRSADYPALWSKKQEY